jgi:hypothetical protein
VPFGCACESFLFLKIQGGAVLIQGEALMDLPLKFIQGEALINLS